MSAWHEELQHEFRIVIVYILLLILSIPSCQARDRNLLLPEGAVWKRSSKVDIPRLYTAYRVLLNEGGGGGDAGLDVDRIGKRIAAAEANTKNLTPLKELEAEKIITANQGKVEKHGHDTDTHARVEKRRDREKGERHSKMKSDKAHVALPDILLSKTNGSLDSKADSPKSAAPNKTEYQDAAGRHLAELSRVYQKYMGIWKSPTPETKGFTLLGQKNAYPANSFRLSALSALVNVVENLKQSNPIDDIVKAINDQMNPEMESLIDVNKIYSNLKLEVAPQEKTSGVSHHFSNIVKRLVPNIGVDVKTGGLYEKYKEKLSDILQVHEQPSFPKADNLGKKLNRVSQCHCDDAKPIIMSVDSDGQKIVKDITPCYCEASRADNMAVAGDSTTSFNGFLPCHCADMKTANLAESNANAERSGNPVPVMNVTQKCDQSNKENNLNGGLKPYYLSNSKHRQMVWNDVPLMRPGSQRKEMTAPRNRERGMGTRMRLGSGIATTAGNENSEHKAKIERPYSGSVQHSSGSTKNKKQLLHLLKTFRANHNLRPKNAKKMLKRGLLNGFAGPPNNLAFPEVLVQRLNQHPEESSSRIIENMAKQLNISPMEVAQRITASSGAAIANSLASQTNGCQVPVTTTDTRAQTMQTAPNLAPILEKILDRLQMLQESNYNQLPADKLPCCFAEPTDGAPCELSGSWESTLLGIRINIGDDKKVVPPAVKPHCIQPKLSESETRRLWRQCVKIPPSETKPSFESPSSTFQMLNVSIEETLPPRPHDMLDNLAEWNFTGRAISTLGGPLTFTCHNGNTNLLGTFLGFCRTCGCIDTIFGSWTFCHPSRDCQDITMSLFERRDVLRRFSLDAKRKERLKEQLYAKSIGQ